MYYYYISIKEKNKLLYLKPSPLQKYYSVIILCVYEYDYTPEGVSYSKPLNIFYNPIYIMIIIIILKPLFYIYYTYR